MPTMAPLTTASVDCPADDAGSLYVLARPRALSRHGAIGARARLGRTRSGLRHGGRV